MDSPITEIQPPAPPESDEPEAREGWSVGTLADADWALRRLGELHREIAENKAILAEQVARLTLRTEKLNGTVQRGVDFFEWKLRAFAENRKAELLGSGKKQSRALAHGSIAWRQVGGKLMVTDPDALLAWARTQPIESGVLRIKEEPAADAVKAHLVATGEVVPGAELEPKREELQFKPIKEGSNGSEH